MNRLPHDPQDAKAILAAMLSAVVNHGLPPTMDLREPTRGDEHLFFTPKLLTDAAILSNCGQLIIRHGSAPRLEAPCAFQIRTGSSSLENNWIKGCVNIGA